MSDYMFMLENHLSAIQNRIVAEVQATAAHAGVNLFLTGGAVRDMLGGFPIRDLDFTVEGNPVKLAKVLEAKADAKVVAVDEHRRSVELMFAGGATAEIAMARQERFPKIGARPVIVPATIQEDLRCRDFTINSIALSLNQASLGLLLDPNNGLADLEHKELRAVHNRVLYDDPGRLLRLLRFQVRFGFTVEERTQHQYENVRLEELEKHIAGRRVFEELKQIAEEASPGEVLQSLAKEKLLELFSPSLAGPKLNLAGFVRLQKAKQLAPFGVDLRVNSLALFLYLLLEKFSPKEKADFAKATSMAKAELDLVPKLAAGARKLEKELKAARIRKASQIYAILAKALGEEILFLYLTSGQRLVQDRIRNYLQKYLPAAQEVTDKQVAALGLEPGTAKFKKAKEEMIAACVDNRVKKTEAPAAEAEPAPIAENPRQHQPGRIGRPPVSSQAHP
jgi:tRNA nucleotidyltransferase/poly(A) polymerase